MTDRQGEQTRRNILRLVQFTIRIDEELNKHLAGVNIAHGAAIVNNIILMSALVRAILLLQLVQLY